MISTLSLDLCFGQMTLGHYRMMGPTDELQNV